MCQQYFFAINLILMIKSFELLIASLVSNFHSRHDNVLTAAK